VAVDWPAVGITGAAVLTGMAVAVGAADAHADRTSINTNRAEYMILLFITILLEAFLRHMYVSRIGIMRVILSYLY
jgi:hypothetical protein